MYERFTDRARKVMQLANQEAQRFNHEYIGTEHVLLGLIKEGSGVAATEVATGGPAPYAGLPALIASEAMAAAVAVMPARPDLPRPRAFSGATCQQCAAADQTRR